MTITKTIKITAQEILEHFICLAEDLTISEAREILRKGAEISYNMDMLELKEIEISYGKQ